MDNRYPPGAEVVEPPVIVQDEEPSKIRQLLSKGKSLVGKALMPFHAAVHLAGKAVGKVANLLLGAASAVNQRVIVPTFDFVETWVPGAGSLRQMLVIWLAVLPPISFIMGIAMSGSFLFGLLCIPLVPFIILTTPALLLQSTLQLWAISAICSLVTAVFDYAETKDARYFLTNLWPGMASVAFAPISQTA